MAKKSQKLVPLTLTEIILRGDADTIRQALEARTQIDTLLEEREAAYQRIAELETQVCDIVGEDGVFPFPEPPMPVAEFAKTPAKKKTAAPKPKPTPETPKPETDHKAPAEETPAEQKSVEAPEASDENEASKSDDA